MINDSMTQCRFCSVPVDPGVAQLIADRQEKANQAYSDASYLRTATIAMYVFFGLSMVPLLGFASWAFLITVVVVIVLLIRWQIRYRALITDDADYKKARRSWWVSMVMLSGVPVIFAVRVVIEVLFLVASGGIR
jgi:heme O synthase-like polyprenyltransferase